MSSAAGKKNQNLSSVKQKYKSEHEPFTVAIAEDPTTRSSSASHANPTMKAGLIGPAIRNPPFREMDQALRHRMLRLRGSGG
jgi:hypothetical protein